jgi:Lrp/AsnC family leucine-responsive transcriptional regulator
VVGLPLQAVVRLRTTHEHIACYVEPLAALPGVIDVVRVTGDDCFVVRCAFAAPASLRPLQGLRARQLPWNRIG